MRNARHITTLLFLSLPIAVSAQGLNITLTPAAVTSSSEEIIFTGILQNATSGTLSLDGIGFSFDGSASSYLADEQNSLGINKVFFDDTPPSLDAGKNYSGPIFGLSIAPNTPAGNYTGAVTITGTNSAGTGYSSSQNFRVSVQVAPEPTQWAALGMGALGLGALALRARRKVQG